LSDAVPPPRRHSSVLIVDDNEHVRGVFVDYVTLMGSEVREASNGLEALGMIEQNRPDLVLLDLKMPRLGGYETVRLIRELDPRVRIIVITGDISEETRCDVERLGLELLLKPIDLQELDTLFARSPSDPLPRTT
jgi:CheY-like chemotaxis protein